MNDFKDKGGRPPLYDDPAVMQRDIDDYFEQCNDEDPPRLTALADYLDMHRDTLREYGLKPKFSAIVKRAQQKVEDSYVKRALTKDKVAGEIFLLKANFGYKEGVEIDHSLKDESKDGKITIEWVANEDKNPGEV